MLRLRFLLLLWGWQSAHTDVRSSKTWPFPDQATGNTLQGADYRTSDADMINPKIWGRCSTDFGLENAVTFRYVFTNTRLYLKRSSFQFNTQSTLRAGSNTAAILSRFTTPTQLRVPSFS